METINWGFIGTGNIASCLAPAVKKTDRACLYGCAARSLAKARSFAEKWDIPVAYGSYDELLSDRKIDVIYIATPHMNHAELAIKAMKAGKAVLCEKPAAVNAAQLREVLEVSKKTGMFFMEALWTRFQPAYLETMRLIKNGEIGAVRAVYADFCSDMPNTPGSRLYEPELAGGALLDMGIYPLSYALSVASAVQNVPFATVKNSAVHSVCRKTPAGVDAFESMILEFTGGETGELFEFPVETSFSAVLTSGIDAGSGDHFKSAKIIGSKATLYIPGFWYAQNINILGTDGSLIEQKKLPFIVNGYEYEVAEVIRCLGLSANIDAESPVIESPYHTHADSMRLIELMDAFRAKWGIVYPFETKDMLSGSKNNKKSLSEESTTSKISIAEKNIPATNSTTSKEVEKTAENKKSAEKVNEEPENDSQEPIVVYTDGACSGNPGRGGWGAVIIVDGNEHTMSGGEKLTTNNRMELMAAIEALEAILEERKWRSRKVTVICDSQYVKNGIQTWIKNWKKNGWRTSNKEPVKNKDLWLELDEVVSKLDIEWRWVKGHAGNKYNEICDKLAVQAGQKQ
ncbi:MAG: ribonuclease HI [Treponemataceae bacterium]|nr:ribonuclease HI [Treponemataceae bacterium]